MRTIRNSILLSGALSLPQFCLALTPDITTIKISGHSSFNNDFCNKETTEISSNSDGTIDIFFAGITALARTPIETYSICNLSLTIGIPDGHRLHYKAIELEGTTSVESDGKSRVLLEHRMGEGSPSYITEEVYHPRPFTQDVIIKSFVENESTRCNERSIELFGRIEAYAKGNQTKINIDSGVMTLRYALDYQPCETEPFDEDLIKNPKSYNLHCETNFSLGQERDLLGVKCRLQNDKGRIASLSGLSSAWTIPELKNVEHEQKNEEGWHYVASLKSESLKTLLHQVENGVYKLHLRNESGFSHRWEQYYGSGRIFWDTIDGDKIAKDAIPIGYEEEAQSPLYLGRAYHSKSIIPGKLGPHWELNNRSVLWSAYDGQGFYSSEDDGYTLLHGSDQLRDAAPNKPSILKWVKGTSDDIPVRAFVGGVDKGDRLLFPCRTSFVLDGIRSVASGYLSSEQKKCVYEFWGWNQTHDFEILVWSL